MTQTELLDTIRAEIERRKERLTPHKGQGAILCREIIKQFDSILSFIDTISQPIMKNDIIGEIRAKIERRFAKYNRDSDHHIQAAECASILDFIDSLPEQPVEGLEEAAWDCVLDSIDVNNPVLLPKYKELLTYLFKAGAEWMKAKMMKEAVEGEICGRVYDHINVRFADGVCKFLEPKNISHIPADVSKFKVGDKVRVIVIKED